MVYEKSTKKNQCHREQSEANTILVWFIKGEENASATSKLTTRYGWTKFEIAIHDNIEESKFYFELLDKIEEVKNDDEIPFTLLGGFTEKLVQYLVENEHWEESKINNYEQVLIKEINDEPIKIGIHYSLVGIVLKSKQITISKTISIRQTLREDFEIEISETNPRWQSPNPSVILTIEDYAENPFDIQIQKELPMTILQLFKVASVKSLDSKLFSESLTPLFLGTTYSNNRESPLHIGIIKESEVEHLIHFWREIKEKIPKSFFDFTMVDSNFKDIAYHRYKDSLLKYGPIEFRITNAMMGLESIFLRDGGELQELSYRLRLRVAKLISNFGYDPFEVTKMIIDAYEVRSKFVHGGLLSFKAKEKLVNNYGSLNKFIEKIIDFLRLAIIVSITIQTSKDELVNIIDKSFLDSNFQNILDQIVTPAKNILKFQ